MRAKLPRNLSLIFEVPAAMGLAFFFLALVLSGKRPKLGLLNSGAFGHFCEELDTLFLRGFNKENHIYWIFTKKSCNLFLKTTAKKNFLILPKIFTDKTFSLFYKTYFLNKLIIQVAYFEPQNYKRTSKSPIIFKTDEWNLGLKFNQIEENIKKRKIVSLYVRTEDFDIKSSDLTPDYLRVRNNNIENFIPMITKFIDEGYYVLRLGRGIASNLFIEGYFEYSRDFKVSDENDFYWANQSNFCISTGFGADEAATMLRKRVYLINIAPVVCIRNSDLFPLALPAIYKDKRLKTIGATEKNLLMAPFNIYKQSKLESLDISCVPNNGNTILKFTEEILKFEKKVQQNSMYLKSSILFGNIVNYWPNFNSSLSSTNE